MVEHLRYPWLLERVDSGGQTGADQAGLAAAVTLGYRTGGLMPLGCRTEVGPRPDVAARFGLTESRFAGYEHRTRQNVHNADGTVICVFDTLDGGSALTKSMADALERPALVCFVPKADAAVLVRQQAITDIRGWLVFHRIKRLNVAGNRETKAPGIFDATYALLIEALRRG